MRQYAPSVRDDRPLHAPGEVVWCDLGNYLEGGSKAKGKMRPMVILRSMSCQHAAAGLTTRSKCVISGESRIMIPHCERLGLNGKPTFIWGPRIAYISRINVRSHAGWVTRDAVFLLREAMPDAIDRQIFADLWAAAIEHEGGER